MPYTHSGQFSDGWDPEAANGYPTLAALKEQHAGAGVRVMEHDLLSKLGPHAKP